MLIVDFLCIFFRLISDVVFIRYFILIFFYCGYILIFWCVLKLFIIFFSSFCDLNDIS